jgi:hypothetical protein
MKQLKLSIILLFSLVITSCYSYRTSAPTVKDEVILLRETDNTSFHKEIKLYFLLGGLIPLSDNKIQQKIREYNLQSVRFSHKVSFLDGLVSFLTYSIFNMHTVVIEGNGVETQRYEPHSSGSKMDRLKELKEALDAGILNEEEYNLEKKKILNE